MEKEYSQSIVLKEKVEQLIQIALTLPEHLQKKVINVGMIGEIKSCALMNWVQSVCVNNPGYDAIDSNENFIQIKTYMTGNKTKMIPAFNPDLKKNKTVDKIALVILDENFELIKVMVASKDDYHQKLLEVESKRENNSKSEKRTKRFDMTIDDFQLINGIEINCK